MDSRLAYFLSSYHRLCFLILLVLQITAQSNHGSPVALNQTVRLLDESAFIDANAEFDTDKECSGNRLEAIEEGRQCSRRCKKGVLCENVRKQCLCDGLCGLSCLKPDLVCPDLPKIENGRFSPLSTLFNTKVKYHCDPGYYLYGSPERLCQGDEEWSGIPAECNIQRKFSQPLSFFWEKLTDIQYIASSLSDPSAGEPCKKSE